jgi:DNA-directed RNA polymerase sigma subunit (sigma70/sigma32)
LINLIEDKRVKEIMSDHFINEKSLADIGREMNISRERVRQLKEVGCRTIKMKLKGIKRRQYELHDIFRG